MRKICVLLFSLLVVSVSLYGLSSPNYFLQLFIDLSPAYMLTRFSMAFILLLYAFWSEVRTVAMRLLLKLGGTALILFGITAFISPTVLGYFDGYVPIGDVGLFLEGGILALLLVSWLPVQRPRFIFAPPLFREDLLTARSQRELPAV